MVLNHTRHCVHHLRPFSGNHLRSCVKGNSPAKAAGNSGPVTTALIKDIRLQRMTITDTNTASATTGEAFPAEDLWKDQPAVVFVVRRPGCPLCREHGEILSATLGRSGPKTCIRDVFCRPQPVTTVSPCVRDGPAPPSLDGWQMTPTNKNFLLYFRNLRGLSLAADFLQVP